MSYEVTGEHAAARRTAVVAERVTWRRFPEVWPTLSGEVWACLHASGITRGCPNVMLYRDAGSDVDVEVGVELLQDCELSGRVVGSTLPAGYVARTVHRGPYSGLGAAHDAVARWSADHGHSPTGIRWEIYGPQTPDPAQTETEVYWLLEQDSPR
ncbi:MAG: GyrI-like domain-containing protein [Pseudolysinimonas sp.]